MTSRRYTRTVTWRSNLRRVTYENRSIRTTGPPLHRIFTDLPVSWKCRKRSSTWCISFCAAQNSLRSSLGAGGKYRHGSKSGMKVLVDSIRSETPRPKSPHMNNEEPIELAHFPGAKPPKPGEKPKIERDDFPAPPYPYTDPGESSRSLVELATFFFLVVKFRTEKALVRFVQGGSTIGRWGCRRRRRRPGQTGRRYSTEEGGGRTE